MRHWSESGTWFVLRSLRGREEGGGRQKERALPQPRGLSHPNGGDRFGRATVT
jgi:hypothetical protein